MSAVLVVALVAIAASPKWRDTSQSVADRVDDLISRLTLEQKVAQLQGSVGSIPASPGLGGVGVPGYSYGRECERGDVSGPLGTDYPSGFGMAATFDVGLIYDIGVATALEVRGNGNIPGEPTGGASCYGPVSNFIKDSRWGRTNEMLTGEDPTLGRQLSRAFTWGIQSNPTGSSKYRMVNTIAKHLNTYGGPEGYGYTFGPHTKRFNVNGHLTEREWREFYLPPFRGSVEAGVTGFMCSYSAITLTDNPTKMNNTPSCANAYMLTDVIRSEWNWDGYILSDAGAIAFIGEVEISPNAGHWHETNRTFGHGYASSGADAAIKAISAGTDIELTCCGAPEVFPTLVDSVKAKKIEEALVDRSLRRTLRYRFELGAMDPLDELSKNPYNSLSSANVSTPAMLQLATEAAEKSIILLKNIHDSLPLMAENYDGKRVCVIGPNGDNGKNMLGGYVNQNPRFIATPLTGIADLLPSAEVIHYQGCLNDTGCFALNRTEVTDTVLDKCDLAVLAIGLTSYAHSKDEPGDACGCIFGDAVEGECCDRQDVKLPGEQLALIQAVVASQQKKGNRAVVFSNNAGMLDLSWAQDSDGVGAILVGGYLGMSSGTAVASTLFGGNNPAGRLPITYYADIDEIGPLGNDYSVYPTAGSLGRTYRFFTGKPPLYPFGYGLSFSEFQYSDMTISPGGSSAQPCTEVEISVDVTNTGGIDGDEVLQLYVSIENASVPTAMRQLVSFQRIRIPAGKTHTALFSIGPAEHAVMRKGDYADVVEPGRRMVWVGASSDPRRSPGVSSSYTVEGDVTEVVKCDRDGKRRSEDEDQRSPRRGRDSARWVPHGANQ